MKALPIRGRLRCFRSTSSLTPYGLLGTTIHQNTTCSNERGQSHDGRSEVMGCDRHRFRNGRPRLRRSTGEDRPTAGTARILSKESFLMAIYAQILSAIFALMAAALWLRAAFVRTPRSFSVQVTTWHIHNSGRVNGSETTGGGHGTSDELVALGTALAWQSRLNARAAALAALSAACQAAAIWLHLISN